MTRLPSSVPVSKALVRWVAALASVAALLLGPPAASAAYFEGPSSAPMNGGAVTLMGHYGTDHPFLCGSVIHCYASIWVHSGGERWLSGACGNDLTGDTEPCPFSVSSPSGQNPLTTATTEYEICDGHDFACGLKTVTWTAVPVDLKISGAPVEGGGFRVRVTNGAGGGLPGYVELYDENRRKPVSGLGYEGDDVYWNLDGCAGPYFSARLSNGDEERWSGRVRVNGITSDGAPCHQDPPAGGGGGGGGGGEDPPQPPTAVIEGPSSVIAPSETELTLRASTPSDYPYWLQVRDMTAGGGIVGSCPANEPSCPVVIKADMNTTETVVHHLVAETHLGDDVVLAGESKDITVYPFPARARAAVKDVSAAFPLSVSAGRITVALNNVKDTPVPLGVGLHLERREPGSARPRWEYVDACTGERLRCQIKYDAPWTAPTEVYQVEFRAVLTYNGRILDRSPVAVGRVYAGLDLIRMEAAVALTAGFCDALIARNPPPHDLPSSLGLPARLCAAGNGKDALLAALLAAGALGNHNELIAWIVNQLAGDGGGGSGGSGGSGAPRELYEDTIKSVAKRLFDNHRGTRGLTRDNANAVAEACMKAAAFSFATDTDDQGLPLGADFCADPTVPIWVVGTDVQEKALHNYDALFGSTARNVDATPNWLVLNYEFGKTKAQIQRNRSWYTSDQRFADLCGDANETTGKECDEFPEYATEQGGDRPSRIPSIRSIPAGPNGREGGLRQRRLIEGCGLIGGLDGPTEEANGTGGDAYLVLPTPAPSSVSPSVKYGAKLATASNATFAICPSGSGGGGGGDT